MTARGIGCGIHYPIPVHLQEAYGFLGYGRDSLPVTEEWAEQCLSLPMYPGLTDEQVGQAAQGLVESVLEVAGTPGGAT